MLTRPLWIYARDKCLPYPFVFTLFFLCLLFLLLTERWEDKTKSELSKEVSSFPNFSFCPWFLVEEWKQKGSLSESLCYWVEEGELTSIPGYVKGCQIWPASLTSCWLWEKDCSWCLIVKNMKLWDQCELLITTCPVQSNHFPND